MYITKLNNFFNVSFLSRLQRVILWNFLQARDSFSDDDTISSIPSFTDPSDSEDDDVYQD